MPLKFFFGVHSIEKFKAALLGYDTEHHGHNATRPLDGFVFHECAKHLRQPKS